METQEKNQITLNEEFSSSISQLSSSLVDHSKRLDSLEREMRTMNERTEKFYSSIERFHEKMDKQSGDLNLIQVKLPNFFQEFIEKNAEKTREIVAAHQVVCSAEMGRKFVSMPEGWKGWAVRGAIILLGTLFGLDLSGVLPILPKAQEFRNELVEVRDIKGRTMYVPVNEIASLTKEWR